jgi:hypothetical protein
VYVLIGERLGQFGLFTLRSSELRVVFHLQFRDLHTVESVWTSRAVAYLRHHNYPPPIHPPPITQNSSPLLYIILFSLSLSPPCASLLLPRTIFTALEKLFRWVCRELLANPFQPHVCPPCRAAAFGLAPVIIVFPHPKND